jgi:AraC-like DNA-binding protein
MDFAYTIDQCRLLPEPRNFFNGKGHVLFSVPVNILFFFRESFDELGPWMRKDFHYRHELILNIGKKIRMMVDERVVELDSGCFLLLMPHQYHQYLHEGQDELSLLFVSFDMDNDLSLEPFRNGSFRFDREALEGVEKCLAIYSSGDPGELPYQVGCLLAHLIGLNDFHGVIDRKIIDEYGLIQKIGKAVFLNKATTVKMLSQQFGLSNGYIRGYFKRVMRISLGRYITEVRLCEALKYLSTTDKCITEIAELCGYESVYSFCRCFKKNFNITPSSYRKGWKGMRDPHFNLREPHR